MMHADPRLQARNYGKDSDGVRKCDIWDGANNDPHHRFTSGRVYEAEQQNGPDRWKIALHRDPYDDAPLPSNVTDYELHCTDENGETYTGTIMDCSVRRQHAYVYIPKQKPAIYTP